MAIRQLPDADLLRKLLRYDPETGKLYWLARPVEMFTATSTFSQKTIAKLWNGKHAGKEALCTLNPDGYYFGSIFKRPNLTHRVIWRLVTNEIPEMIDHINGDRADNRLCNLRAVTAAENPKNMKRPAANKSGHMGVHWSEERQRWCASIRANGVRRALGRYKRIEDAIYARKKAEREFGFHPNHGRKA